MTEAPSSTNLTAGLNADLNIFNLSTQWFQQNGISCQAFSLTESTNLLAKIYAPTDPPVTIYIADQQSHGRGRGDHTWSTPPSGTALLATWSFHVSHAPQHLTAPLAGLDVDRALHAIWPSQNWSLKAPNDVYLHDLKIGGLLVESLSTGNSHRLLIGFGMNVLETPSDVPWAGSLRQGLKEEKLTEPHWQGFLHHLHHNFLSLIGDCATTSLSLDLRQKLTMALKKNPHHENLKELTSEGHLIYDDTTQDGSKTTRTVDWHRL